MAARLIRPLYARFDRTGKADTARPRPAANTSGGAPRVVADQKSGAEQRGHAPVPPTAKTFEDRSIKVQRDDKPIAEERREPSLSPPLKSSKDVPIKVQREDRAGTDEYAHAPPPPRTESSNDGAIKVLRDHDAGTDEYGRTPLLLQDEIPDDGASKVRRDDKPVGDERLEPSLSAPRETLDEARVRPHDKIVLEELEREHQFKAALGLMAKTRSRPRADETIDTRTIIRVAAAVIVLGLGFTALLPSILTRDPADPTVTLTTSAPPALAAPAQTEQTAVAPPVPAPPPAPLPTVAPAPAPVAPAPNAQAAPAPKDIASVAKTTPALRGTNAPAALAQSRATERASISDGGKAAGGLALTAEEKAAVARGLQALEKQAPVPGLEKQAAVGAPRRPGLTAEEQAAVERGLRELEKTAGQAKP